MSEKNKCPVCGSDSTSRFLERQQVPVHQNLLIEDQESATAVPRGDIELVLCQNCGFIYNRAFKLSKLSYGEDYDNTQSYSPSFNEYLDRLVHYLIHDRGVRNCNVVEVGCGKGVFLRKLVERGDNNGYGFDPSYVGPPTDLEGRLKFERRYYGPECTDVPADVVVCRHVIEHVPEPLSLLQAIRKALVHSAEARVYFETPCVEWILQNQVVWDFFYEHCSYFTAESLTTAFALSGFKVESAEHVFEGQYLWLEATLSGEKGAVTKPSDKLQRLVEEFASRERQLREELEVRVRELASQERVALWGAGAKGVTLANLIDPRRELLTCVVDLNPQKQGHFIPGTGHAIVGYQELEKYGVSTALLMNPNYRQENMALLREANLNVRLI
jgi:SAM-dependent methyltransferase